MGIVTGMGGRAPAGGADGQPRPHRDASRAPANDTGRAAAMTEPWDAVIVGARVAGSATALQLARAGWRVLCIDRARRGSDTLSTHALMRGGVALLHRWGVPEACRGADTPPIRRTAFDYGDDRVEVSIKPSAGVDALYAPRRTVLDAALVAAAERAGAVFEFGSTVTGLRRDPSGAVNGVVVTSAGATRVVPARLVIGADGRSSAVAEHARPATVATGRHAAAVLYGYWSGLPDAGYEWFYRPGVSAGVIPTSAGQTCVFVAGQPATVAAAGADPGDAYRAILHRIGLADRFREAELVGRVRHAHGLPVGYLREPFGPGWALVGDAGHWLDPMSTHGMTAALRDADLLGRALTGSAAGSPERVLALDEYRRIRERLSLPMLRASDEIAGHEWDMAGIRRLLRALAATMADEVDVIEDRAAA